MKKAFWYRNTDVAPKREWVVIRTELCHDDTYLIYQYSGSQPKTMVLTEKKRCVTAMSAFESVEAWQFALEDDGYDLIDGDESLY